MNPIIENLEYIQSLIPDHVTLVAVSKTKPAESILEVYQTGHKIFGENKVQELVDKYAALPKDIEWHLIGHLQSNKVKYIAPFVTLIHAVDSVSLLGEIDKRAKQNNRTIDCLLQLYIAEEESKFGFAEKEIRELTESMVFEEFRNVRIRGMMGMASFTSDQRQVREEFNNLKNCFQRMKPNFDEDFNILSMGMSNDFQVAIECGSNMVRIGSSIFGGR